MSVRIMGRTECWDASEQPIFFISSETSESRILSLSHVLIARSMEGSKSFMITILSKLTETI